MIIHVMKEVFKKRGKKKLHKAPFAETASSSFPGKNTIPSQERRPVFAVGCGRSGTHFIARLMKEDPAMASYHLDDIAAPVADSFFAYCCWNKLPVDMEGFYHERTRLMQEAENAGKTYFESNPYLAFGVRFLYERFQPLFLHMVRNPEATVNSHYIKGWYKDPPVKSHRGLCLGYQYPLKSANHFFGRIVPNGVDFDRWMALTRIGKIAWMWNVVNMAIADALKELPQDHVSVVKLEAFDYGCYRELCRFVGVSNPLAEGAFEKIRRQKPGKGPRSRSTDDWTNREYDEFRAETSAARKILGY